MSLCMRRRGIVSWSRTITSRASGRQSGPGIVNRQQLTRETKKSRLPLYLGGAFVYVASIYFGATLYQSYAAQPSTLEHQGHVKTDASHVYDANAAAYDQSVQYEEFFSGISWIRRGVVRDLSGNVLEVSAGTGRNLSYYNPDKVTSLTLLDQSTPMLDVARDKVMNLPNWKGKVTFKDTALEGLSPERDSYNVVFQSFGLCSVTDPVSFLSHMSSFCRADGEIVLIEHGRSSYAWINRLLDGNVARHAAKWGCYNNRDIQEIVQSCKSVEIVSCKRRHFGTTYIYHLRPL